MPESGANRSEPGATAAVLSAHSSPVLTLGNLAHIGLLTAIAASALFSAAIGFGLGWPTGAVCLVATAALVAAALPLLLAGRADLVEPVWFVVATVFIGVTGKAFYVLFGPPDRLDFLLLDKQPDDLLFAALVIAAGVLGLSFGYLKGNVRWRIRLLDRLAAESWHPRRFVAVVGLLVVIGLTSFLLFALHVNVSFDSLTSLSAKRFAGSLEGGGLALTGGYQRWGALLLEIAFYIVFARWAAARGTLWSSSGLWLVALALLAVAFPIFVSSRQTVMFLIIRVVLIWMCLRGEPKPRTVLLLVVAGLLTIGTVLASRRGHSDWESIRAHSGPSELLEVTVGGRHFLDLTKTAHVLDAFPAKLDYQYGKSMVTWIAAPVPRAWWPEKPVVGVGGELGTVVFQKPVGTGGVPPAAVGELYLNFGLLGVLIGMPIAGFLLRSLYSTLSARFPDEAFVLIYALLSTRLALGMLSNSVSGSTSKLLQEMVPLLIALYACSAPRRREGG